MSKNQQFVRFDKVDKSYDGKVLVVKDLKIFLEQSMQFGIQKHQKEIYQ